MSSHIHHPFETIYKVVRCTDCLTVNNCVNDVREHTKKHKSMFRMLDLDRLLTPSTTFLYPASIVYLHHLVLNIAIIYVILVFLYFYGKSIRHIIENTILLLVDIIYSVIYYTEDALASLLRA